MYDSYTHMCTIQSNHVIPSIPIFPSPYRLVKRLHIEMKMKHLLKHKHLSNYHLIQSLVE